MKVTIVSPEKTLFSGEADCVAVPGKKGRFEVLNNHAPIVSTLSKGRVECKGSETQVFDINGGFIEVAKNEVNVCIEMNNAR